MCAVSVMLQGLLWETFPTLFSLETLFWFPNKGQYILMVSLLFVQNYALDVCLFFSGSTQNCFIHVWG